MKSTTPSDFGNRLELLDFDAIADPLDKIAECKYFLDLASNEPDLMRFRWQVSAFLGAAYSFFEICVLNAFHAFTDPQTGKPVENDEAIKTLRSYVTITRNKKNPSRIDTGGKQEITMQLYELRRGNTHHFPLSIMVAGTELPEAFHFGYVVKGGTPALAFCRSVMSLIQQVQEELETC